MANPTTPAAAETMTFIDDMSDADLDALLGMDEWTDEDEAEAVEADAASYAAKVAALADSDEPAYDLNQTAFAALSTAGFLTAGRSAAAHNLARAGFLARADRWSPWTRTPAGDSLLAAQ